MEKETNEFPKGSIQKETKPNNKRKVVFWSLLASGVGVIIIVALLLIFLLPKEEKYNIELGSNVSIEGEVLSGNGSYKKGDSVTIVADEITGYRFTGWSFNGNIISTDKEYTFIIGEDTEGEYTANYDKLYSILVEDAHNSVSIVENKTQAIEDEKVEFTITPNPDYRFISVKVNEDILTENDGKYTFEMPAEDVTIIVTYAEEYAITIDSSVSDMVTSVSLDKAISGEQVVVTANIQDKVTEDYVIMSDGLYYIENGSEEKVTINQTEGQYSFTMPANDITIGVESQSYRRLDDFTFSGNAITGYTGNATELTLPSYYETVDVNSQNYTIEKDTGTEITEIGEFAFQDCTSLSSIVIPSEIAEIGMGAFYNCTNLQTVDLGDNSHLQIIDEGVFASTGLINISIPSSVTEIGGSAFSNCTNLTDIYYQGTLDQWLDISVDTPNWSNCNLYIDNTLVEEITINKNIKDYAFYGIISLKKVIIEEGVTSIGNEYDSAEFSSSVFSGCTNLTSITIPASVTEIGSQAFQDCFSLAIVYNNSSLNITAGSIISNGNVGYYAYEIVKPGEEAKGRIEEINNMRYYINDTTQTKVALWMLDRAASTVSLEEDTTAINQFAFKYCTNLQTVDFGDNSQLKSIGDRAFTSCTNLTSITIPANVTEIGYCAFDDCDSLTSVTIESDDIYKIATSSSSVDFLLENATTVKVLKTIVDTCDNDYFENTSYFTASQEGEYTVFTKVSA